MLVRVAGITPQQTGQRIVQGALDFVRDKKNLESIEKIRSLVRLVVPEHHDPALAIHSEIAATYHYVSQHLRYTRDPQSIELHYSAGAIMERIARGEIVCEDCDSYAGMTLGFLWALGRRARLALVGFGQLGRYQHVYTEALQPGPRGSSIPARWVAVDPSMGEHFPLVRARITTGIRIDPFAPPKKRTVPR